MHGAIITLTGPSGVGKGYLKERLKRILGLSEPDVFTTRKSRRNEKGKGRVFVSKQEFLRRQKNRGLVFVQELYGNLYGFDRNAFSGNRNTITEIHAGIAKQFREMFPKAIMVAIIPGNQGFLRQRLQRRCESPEETKKRLSAAQRETSAILALKKTFNINYKVGFGNENRIVADIAKKVSRRMKNAGNKALRKKAEKPADAWLWHAGRKKRAIDSGTGKRRWRCH
jgi:guanylate kinase